ncbi:MAG: O-methyltransferase, partial [Gemmatimonadales bacterium]
MTDETQWTAVDRYITDQLVPSDNALDAALAASAANGLPAINVAPNQGKLLQILARSIGARRILEVGTLGGYSTIFLARALPPGGKLVTLEYDRKHADVARANIERAGLSHMVDIRLGKAIESLPKIAAEGGAPFDFVFIDADKPGNPDYFAWALKLARVGTMIVVDNVVRKGGVIDAAGDANVQGARRVLEAMAKEPRVNATAVQTVGSK